MITFYIKRRAASFFLTLSVLSFTLALAAFFTLFTGCTGAAGSNTTSANNASSANTAAGNTSTDKTVAENTTVGSTAADAAASFSAKIDGVDFSSNKGSDNLNAAFRMKEGDKHLFFMLTDIDNPIQKLNFDIPASIGTTTISITPKYSFTGYINKDMAPYDDDGVTVTVTSLTATRVSGTFSGTYKAEAGWPKAKPSIQVTEGKFDIPFSTSAQWKKMYQAE